MYKNVSLASLGCSKNLVDAEQMLGLLTSAGYNIVENEEDADVIIVNTCTFIEAAKNESIECILELADYKNKNCKALIVTGCLAQRYREQILFEMPEVDAVVGTGEYDRIVEIIKQLENNGGDILCCGGIASDEAENLPRVRTTPPYTAFLKIAEGCDNHCTYCVIPSIRGRYRSRSIDDILAEARQMAKDGVKEIIVIAQDTTRYGKDIYGEYCLPRLLKELCAVDGIEWVRVHYCYPELVTDELIKVFKTEDKLCNYFDIPIQHCCDRILKLMGRRTNSEQIRSLISKIRAEIPDAAIRTSIIVGFPGETQEEFEELCEFVKEIRFERMGVFAYSREEDTPAYDFVNQIDEDEKMRRRDLLMLIQSDIAQEQNSAKIGTKIRVLTEDKDEIIKSYFGRTYADSEEVDGKVFFKADRVIQSGEFVEVEVEQAMEYDLFGKEI